MPGGAKPSYAQDYYDRDNAAYREWDAISKDKREVRGLAGGAVSYEADEMMSIAAARALKDVNACFVGIGLPSTGANLARRTYAPDLVLVYEAGAIGAKPPSLPLSIGDGMLGETADAIVSVPEMFNYWVQSGRIDVGFLGAAQIDRYANINTTVIGGYDDPKVRLPGAGGAPEIAASCGEVIVIVRQTPRAFVEQVDFVTSVGHGSGPGERERLGLQGKGPTKVITDLGILEPDPETKELVLTHAASGDHRRAGPGGDRLGAEDRRRAEDHRAADRRRAAQAARAGGGMSAYILDAVRTPFGRYGGALAKVRPDDLGAHVVKAILERDGHRSRADRRRQLRQRQRRGRGQPQRRPHGRAARRAARRASRRTPSTASADRRSTPRCSPAARSRPATPTSCWSAAWSR